MQLKAFQPIELFTEASEGDEVTEPIRISGFNKVAAQGSHSGYSYSLSLDGETWASAVQLTASEVVQVPWAAFVRFHRADNARGTLFVYAGIEESSR